MDHAPENAVYILECADHSLYTGWTNALPKRMLEHAQGKGAKYTRSRLPVSMVYQEICPSPTAARKREAAIKKLSRKEKQALVARYDQLLALALQKLAGWQIEPETLLLLREKAGIALFILRWAGQSAVLKLFLTDLGRGELACYDLLEQAGLCTLPLIQKDQDALLMEDLNASPRFALARREDMNSPLYMGQLGRWYGRLHRLPKKAISALPVFAEWQALNAEQLAHAHARFKNQPAWQRLHPLLMELIKQAARLPLALCYNDFYFENMVVGRAEPLALMMDYGRMARSYPGMDLVNALWFSNEAARKAFFLAYGRQGRARHALGLLLAPLAEFLAYDGQNAEDLLSDAYYEQLKQHFSQG